MNETITVSSLVILSVVSFVLNGFCIYIIKTNTSFHEKPSSAFIVNLFLTHLFQAMFVFPLYAGKKIHTNDFLMAQFFSNGFRFTYFLAFYGGCLCVLCIAVDRFLATFLLTDYKIYVTFKNVICVMGSTWLYVILLCLIPFIPSYQNNHSSDHHLLNAHQHVNTTQGQLLQTHALRMHKKDNMMNSFEYLQKKVINLDLKELNDLSTKEIQSQIISEEKYLEITKFYYYVPQKEWTIFMLFFNAALPLIIITLCYLYIVHRLKDLNRFHIRAKFDINGEQQTQKQPKIKEFHKYKEITTLTCILVIAYTFCWSPSIIYYTTLSVCEKKCFVTNWNNSATEQYVVFMNKYISFLNSVFSPIIYCLHRPEVQMKLFKVKQMFLDNDKYDMSDIEKEEQRQMVVKIKEMPFSNIATVPVFQTYANNEIQ